MYREIEVERVLAKNWKCWYRVHKRVDDRWVPVPSEEWRGVVWRLEKQGPCRYMHFSNGTVAIITYYLT